jgi:hypothetical protein
MRDDLKLAAYAVALGYTLSLDRQPHGAPIDVTRFQVHNGVPADGLQFERNGVHVWDTARGWRVAKLQGDRFPKPDPADFHSSLYKALNRGVELGDA